MAQKFILRSLIVEIFICFHINLIVVMLVKTLIFLYFFLMVNTILNLEEVEDLSNIDLSDHPLIKVQKVASRLRSLQLDETSCFILSYRHRSKKKAYNYLKMKFSEVKSVLENGNTIESPYDLIKSNIKSRYITRTKQWEFRRTFAISKSHTDRAEIGLEIKKIGAKELSSVSEITHLDDQYKRLQTILAAKEQLQSVLNKTQKGLKVLEIVDVNVWSQRGGEEEGDFGKDLIQMMEYSQNSMRIEVVFKIGKNTEGDKSEILFVEKEIESISDGEEK